MPPKLHDPRRTRFAPNGKISGLGCAEEVVVNIFYESQRQMSMIEIQGFTVLPQ
jgi:hypothetical protein